MKNHTRFEGDDPCRCMTAARVVVAAVSLLLLSCSGGGGGDASAPMPATADVLPLSGTVIGPGQSVSVTFSRSMNPASLALGGTMGAGASGAWSATGSTDDTLTITPAATWTEGAQTLTVDVKDTQGVPVTQILRDYTVDATAPTVSSVSPADGATVSASAQIVVHFSESLASGSLVLGGTLAAESNGGVWSTTTVPSDTLTFSPDTAWTAGSRSLSINATDVAGNALATASYSFTVDTTLPTARPNYKNGIRIPETASIVISFSKSMDTSSLKLGGELAGESNGGTWSTVTNSNDTLTINPTGTWFSAPGRHLTVDAKDLVSQPVATVTLTYDIYRGILYYVDTNRPDDTGTGLSPATAKKFIHSAVAAAGSPATILVRAGDYRLSSALGTQVKLKAGVSLWGGYASTFTARDPVSNVTNIIDRSTTGGTATLPQRAIEGDSSGVAIGADTVVDGFTIQGSTQGAIYTAGILLINGASPTIRNNDILSENDSKSYGMFNDNSSPVVENNNIYGYGAGINNRNGSSPTVQDNNIRGASYGMYNFNASSAVSKPVVQNNDISASAGIGMYNYNFSPVVQNNTVFGGSEGIDNQSSSSPTVQNNAIFGGIKGMANNNSSPTVANNIVFTGSGSTTHCIDKIGAAPQSLRNNDLFNCAVVYVDYDGGCSGNGDGDNDSTTCSLGEMNALTNIPSGVGGNISVDPQFVDPANSDWHLSGGSPASVTAGGLNGIDEGWSFTTDKDGVARPASGSPWAIGAYEP